MLVSMTGFGRAESELESKRITVEAKSLNSKQLDLIVRMPPAYREYEIALRNDLSKKLVRGKIEVVISVESMSEDPTHKINDVFVMKYIEQLSKIARELDILDSERLLDIAMRLPDSLVSEKSDPDEKEWNSILNVVYSALDLMKAHQSNEGKALESDIKSHIINIASILDKVEPYENERTENLKERLQQNLEENKLGESFDPNRFHQELIYYLEKLDITEEKVRLRNHCNYFLETVQCEEPVGRKLGFISQEIGREINTLGSKANSSDIQKLVVEMKDELEKVKEQLLNVM
jgi:uncharacterized protein (TIGR00255 family)